MRHYVTLNQVGLCIGYQSSSEEILDDSLVDVSEMVEDGTSIDDFLWRKYTEGIWSEEKFKPDPPAPAPDPEQRIIALETENELLRERVAQTQDDVLFIFETIFA
ncbi:hypothetical protein [Cohnella abietis]|uniref:Uncharacterized protein n=1 Tax=Cohnella abietis TaxID=2507935 RepID=A0A3T1D2Z0_9BACL|nr:hypothetical protein [Cohnella abietis]BBI32375.1 hypothetical protein KCTCHS21_17740 [Cohnella abietis]